MNKKISIWWLVVLFFAMGFLNQKCTNNKLKPLLEEKEMYLKRLDSLKKERELYTLKFKDSLLELREKHKQYSLEANKRIQVLQHKKRQYEKAITEYNNSDFDSKFELFSNLIKKDSLQ